MSWLYRHDWGRDPREGPDLDEGIRKGGHRQHSRVQAPQVGHYLAYLIIEIMRIRTLIAPVPSQADYGWASLTTEKKGRFNGLGHQFSTIFLLFSKQRNTALQKAGISPKDFTAVSCHHTMPVVRKKLLLSLTTRKNLYLPPFKVDRY